MATRHELTVLVTLISGIANWAIIGVDVEALKGAGDRFAGSNGINAEYRLLTGEDVDILPGDEDQVLGFLAVSHPVEDLAAEIVEALSLAAPVARVSREHDDAVAAVVRVLERNVADLHATGV